MENDTPQQDTSPAQPQEQTGVPESATPATPAHEEADAVSGQPQEDNSEVDYSQAGDAEPDDDVAPDADEPGDDVAPEEVENLVQDQPDQPDEVDREG